MTTHVQLRITLGASTFLLVACGNLLLSNGAAPARRTNTRRLTDDSTGAEVGRFLTKETGMHGKNPIGSLSESWFEGKPHAKRRERTSKPSADNNAEDIKFESVSKHGGPTLLVPRRFLLQDISPPEMWPVTDAPPEFSGRRALESAATYDFWIQSKFEEAIMPPCLGRTLLRDISPPGMWPSTDAPPSEFDRRRLLELGARSAECACPGEDLALEIPAETHLQGDHNDYF